MPSYLALMSGLYPRAHLVGVTEQAGAELDNFDRWQVADSRWTIAEALRARGYRTAAFIDTFWLSPLFGFDQGFDHFDGQAALAPFSDMHAGIEMIVKQLVPPWLAAGPSGVPPFLFLHALDAHGPYLPEEPFRDAFAASLPGDRRATPAGSANQTYRAIPDWMARTEVPDEAVPIPPELPLETIVERYDETLLKVDAYLGELVALLKSRGIWDDCVLIVTGDHGETFGPGVYGHGVLREPVLHVPLLLKLPHGEHAGTHVSTPVQLVDLYPTLLELAGAPPAPNLHGESLLRRLEEREAVVRAQYTESGWVEQYSLTEGRWKIVEERPGSESAEQSLLTHPRVPEAWLREHYPEVLERPLSHELLRELAARPDHAARMAELRALVAGPYYMLYDVEADPDELHDRSASEPEVLARMQRRLDEERQRSLRAQAEADPNVHRQKLGQAARDQLHALGYVGDDADEGQKGETKEKR
jgi:arylsulfatase A-like enzyme